MLVSQSNRIYFKLYHHLSFPTGRLADTREEFRHASEGERATSRVRFRMEWPLAASLTGPGVAGGRLET